MAGWIKLHRSLFDHWVVDFKDPGKALAWVDLISMANHTPAELMIKNTKVYVGRGQSAHSQLTLQKRWKWSQNKVKRFLLLLKKEGMIDFETDALTTIITICNYETYQAKEETGERTGERPHERTGERSPDDQSNDKEEGNNDKNGKKKKKSKTLTPAEREGQEKRREVWNYYKDSFFARYSVDPIRNAKVNSLIKKLHESLGEEAKFVAAFYVTINDQFLIKQSHSLGPLLQNCEGYTTQWRRGQAVTTTSARQTDQSQSNYDAAEQAIAIRRARNADGD